MIRKEIEGPGIHIEKERKVVYYRLELVPIIRVWRLVLRLEASAGMVRHDVPVCVQIMLESGDGLKASSSGSDAWHRSLLIWFSLWCQNCACGDLVPFPGHAKDLQRIYSYSTRFCAYFWDLKTSFA